MTTTNEHQKSDQLTELNKHFANRYTAEDKEYTDMIQRSSSPPIIEDWGPDRPSRGSQQFDHNNQRRNFSNPRQGHQNYYSNDRQQNRNHSNDHRHYRNHSNDNRQRSRSPHYHDKR